MCKTLTLTIFVVAVLLINPARVEPGTSVNIGFSDTEAFGRLCGLLKDAKVSDLSFCLGYIKKSKDSNDDIANFILTWSPDTYKKEIPSIFRTKIDRIIKKLSSINYQQLIIDIDLIKNSQLTISEMVRLIKGTRLYKND